MKLITRQGKADKAAAAWERSYRHSTNQRQQGITAKLNALSAPVDPDEVDRIIGNDSWTQPGHCSECHAISLVLVEVGEEPDYESSTAYLCLPCVEAALALLKGSA